MGPSGPTGFLIQPPVFGRPGRTFGGSGLTGFTGVGDGFGVGEGTGLGEGEGTGLGDGEGTGLGDGEGTGLGWSGVTGSQARSLRFPPIQVRSATLSRPVPVSPAWSSHSAAAAVTFSVTLPVTVMVKVWLAPAAIC